MKLSQNAILWLGALACFFCALWILAVLYLAAQFLHRMGAL
ncbi:hypothetical protein LCGC14_2731480 [marine sediment metagenome]|uniref:Lipoprotein n=1 Tax=marine sediment metagenome TaxID=412755 RepID=A0A0F8Z775_9ZZZZ